MERQDWEELERISLEENSNKYRRVKKSLFGDPSGKIKTFAIISPENPLNWENSSEDEFKANYAKWVTDKKRYNREALSKMKVSELLHKIQLGGRDTLRYGGFTYVPLKGLYKDSENSFLILNLPLKDARIIARDYGQESFFWGKVSSEKATPSTIGYYVASGPECNYVLQEVSNTIYDQADADDYFSKFGLKFRIGLKTFGDIIPEVVDVKAFEESFEESRTFTSRALKRRAAVKKNN